MGNKSTPILWWLIILILAVPLGIYLIRQDQTPKVQAVAPAPVTQCSLQSPNPRVRNGLISTSILYNNFSNTTGTCVIDPNRAPLRSREIPSYDTLKSKYFDQAKTPTIKTVLEGDKTQADIPLPAGNNRVYYIRNGSLTMGTNIPVYTTGVIFVDHNLTINGHLTDTNNTTGLVFVVKGDVIINPLVTTINAVLISSGTVYTAGNPCTTSNVSAPALTINGSLISLKQPPIADPNASYIKFCRKLADNAQAAEQIIQQPKYLVILKDIVADTLQTWSEIP